MASSMDSSVEAETTSSQSSHPFYNHPKVHEMRSFGFGNEEQIKQSLLVYLDLLEAKRWWNVRTVPCSGLHQILVCGHPGQREPLEVVLPVRQDNQLSICDLQHLLVKVKAEQECNSLTLALMDSDSSIVYYKISDGFIPPDPPESLQEKKKQSQRKFQHRKARFIPASHHISDVRERYNSLGRNPRTSTHDNLPVGNTLSQNHIEACESHNLDTNKDSAMRNDFSEACSEETRQREVAKRPLDDISADNQDGSKHRKLGSAGHTSSSSTLDCGMNSSPKGYQEPAAGPSYGIPVQENVDRHFQPAESGSSNKEDEGVHVAMAVVQAPVIENDSDHDSGMDAGEDDEDEGFDEEL